LKLTFPAIALAGLSLALGWAVMVKGGVWPDDWCVSLIAIGVSSCGFWAVQWGERGGESPRHALKGWLGWLLAALLFYIIFTVIPLPVRLLAILSPSRAALLDNLHPVIPGLTAAPLSVNPPATLLHLFSIAGYIATFLLIREVASSFRSSPWIPALPLVLLAVFEAVVGLTQTLVAHSLPVATGTYTNRDHFAGFLEMVLPFTVLCGVATYRRKIRGAIQTKAAVLACSLWGAGALLFLAIVYSLSRMGFIVALFVVLLVTTFAFVSAPHRQHPRLPRWFLAAGLGAAILIGCVLLSPDQLAGRFASVSSSAEPRASASGQSEIRSSLWRETLPLIAEYKLFGCGLGGFESAFLKHQAVANQFSVEFAHNDYLQYLAELGIVGFTLLAAIVAVLVSSVLRAFLLVTDQHRRLLSMACLTAFAAIALHSFVDFNTYIPANAMTLVWIAGIASANAAA
jgi:O-antigen ligase